MKTIVVITAGRQRYMEKLILQLKEEKEYFDELQLWDNARTYSDRMYIFQLSQEYPWIKYCEKPKNCGKSIGLSSFDLFYEYILEPNCLFIKIDDDVVFLERGLINKVREFRLKNPDPPVVYVNTINNGICAYLQQNNGNGLLQNFPKLELKADNQLWRSGELAYKLQKEFREDLNKLRHEKWYVKSQLIKGRFSINCISWTTESIPNIKECVGNEDEEWLTVDLPKILGKENILFGETVCQHFAYFPQRYIQNGLYLDSKLNELA